jgi:peptidoglycan/xylan/chitin deacetylase (PgdA/CDA1 family)
MGPLRALAELGASFHNADVVVLCYHRIRSREHFRMQMDLLADGGYRVLSMGQFLERLNKPQGAFQPAVLLTFDGCSSDQLEHAVPVLQSLNFPATFFPVTAFLDCDFAHQPLPWRESFRDLTKAGHTIGCHSHTHADLTELPRAQIHQEVVVSKRILEEAIGQPVQAFCYPFGRWDASIASIVRDAGYEVAFTVDLGGVSPANDPYQLKRAAILGEPGRAELKAFLSGRFLLSGGLLLSWKVRERLLDLRES